MPINPMDVDTLPKGAVGAETDLAPWVRSFLESVDQRKPLPDVKRPSAKEPKPPTAEVLREEELPPVEITGQAEKGKPEGTGQIPLTDLWKTLETMQAPWADLYAKAVQARMGTDQTHVRPALEGVKAAAGAPVPPVPGSIPEPPVPSRKPRPFLDVEGKNALTAVVNGLGLIAGILVGGGRAPVAALSSLTGAMKGWQEGDRARADAQWQEYLAKADTIRTENAQSLKIWQAAMEASGANLQKAQAMATAALGEAGLDDHLADLAHKGFEQAGQSWDRMYGAWRDFQANNVKLMLALQHQQNVDRAQAEAERHHRAAEAAQAGQAPSPEAVKTQVDNFVSGGAVPAFGMGAAANPRREAFWTALGQRAEAAGGMGNLVATRMKIGNLKGAAAQVEKNMALVEAFSGTAEKNLRDALALSDEVDRTGSPLINRWLLAGRKAWSGEAKVVDFDVSARTAINETARVLNSANASGVISDHARVEIESMLNTALNKDQFRAAVQRLVKEMGNRREAYQDELRLIEDQVREAAGGKAPKPAAEGAKIRVRRKSDGQTGTLDEKDFDAGKYERVK